MTDETPRKRGRKPKLDKGSRRNFQLPSCSDQEIAYLKERCMSSSDSEVIRNALHVHAGLLKRIDEGQQAALRREDGVFVILHELALTSPQVPPAFMK